MMTKNLTILGSTGSIGRQTLEVVEQLPVRVAALTAGQNVERMAEQCRRFRPQLAVMGTEEAAQRLREALAGEKIEIRSGMDGLIAAAEHPLADTVVTAVVGMLGLRPTLAAIRAKKRIALANKETLVCAGELVMREAAAAGAEVVPGPQRDPPPDPDMLRRAVLRQDAGQAAAGDEGRRPAPPELENGREDHH